MNFSHHRSIFIFIFFFSIMHAAAQPADSSASSSPLPHAVLNIENDSDYASFGMLDTMIQGYKVFFVGENHTFRESNSKLELKMFKYLYHKAGVRNLFFELGYSRGWLVDKYVQTGDTAIFKILENYSYSAYADLYKGLMEFNRTLDSNNKIRIIGLDVERFFELTTKVLSMIIPQEEAPKEISLHIESLAGLAGYFDKYLKESRTDSYNARFSTGHYSAAATMNAVIKNFNEHREIYKTYLGADFNHFEIIIQSLETHQVWDKYDEEKMVQEYVYREQYIYQQFLKVLEMYPDEKYFGQFGRCHVATRIQKEACNWYEYNSIASRISNSRNPSIHNKVFSIACFYPKSDQFDEVTDENEALKGLQKFAADDSLTLFPLMQDSSYRKLTERYHCVIVNNTSQEGKTFIPDQDQVKSRANLNASITYGQRFIDLSSLSKLYQSMGNGKLNNVVGQAGINFGITHSRGTMNAASFNFFGPIKHVLNDSTEVAFSGASTFIYGGKDLIRKRWLDVIPLAGVGLSSLNLLVSQDNYQGSPLRGFFGENSERIYRNPALMLDPGVHINLNFKFLSLGIYGSYLLDLSAHKWQISDKLIPESIRTNQSGFNAGVKLGVLFRN